MANRSYLYSADSLPDAEGKPTGAVHCISEHNWRLPLAHKLLMARGTQVVPSMLITNQIGIAADFAGGTELLLAVLRMVGEGEVPDRVNFDRQLETAQAHLKRQQAKYFLLETFELLQDLEHFHWIVEDDIPEATRLAESILAGGDQAELASLRATWHEHFDSFYSDYLYFTFNDH